MKNPTGRRRRSQVEIAQVLGEYRRSGLSQAAFAAEHGIAFSTLTYWLRQARRAGVEEGCRKPARSIGAQLVPVRLVDSSRLPSSVLVELESAQGYVLRFPAGLAPDLLAGYVRALDSRC